MHADTLKKMFDPFFSTKFTGRGLGMSAVLGIVHGHKGLLKVDSKPTQGSTFHIAFPTNTSKPMPTILQHHDTKQQGHGTILVIDDEEDIREVACIALEEIGYTTINATDGQDGINMFLQHQSTIVGIILDLTMPRMNGEACYHALRKIAPEVRVILSSGYSEEDVAEHFHGKGLSGFMQKPYHVQDFQKAALSCFQAK